MIEYKVVTLRGPDNGVWESDLNVLAKDGWRVLLLLKNDGWPVVLLERDIDPAQEPSP